MDTTVSVPQMRVLVLLWTGEPLNLSAVAEGLGVNASNASRTCDRLVAAGLVERAASYGRPSSGGPHADPTGRDVRGEADAPS